MDTLSDTLTQQIRSIRVQKAISIAAIAEQLGMNPEGYMKIENGETELTLKAVEDIANVLEVGIPDLLSSPSSIIAHANTATNAEMSSSSAVGSGTTGSPHSNTNSNSNTYYIGVSSEVLEKLLRRIDKLEAELAASRKQQ